MNGREERNRKARGADEKLVRSFVALPLPEEWQSSLAGLQRQLAEHIADVRWMSPEKMHLTLSFLGDQTEEALDKIAAIMLSVNTLPAPFKVRPAEVGVFPNERRARVLWLGLEAPQTLVDLQQDLKDSWRCAGLAFESRAFRPHLTLGRLRKPHPVAKELLARFTAEPESDWRVDRVVLYESRLKPGGAEHSPRQVVLLTG